MQTDLKFFGIPALEFMFLAVCLAMAVSSLINIIIKIRHILSPKINNMQHLQAFIQYGIVFFSAEGIYEFIDNALSMSTTPKREKEVLRKFKKVFMEFESKAKEANNRTN